MSKGVNIGFLGIAHFHSNSYARALRSTPGAKVVGVFDESSERGRTFAKQHGIDYYPSPERLLKRTDAVVVTSETARHHGLALAAAEAGNHVLCEKPIATSIGEALEMISAVDKKGLTLQMCYVLRYHAVASLVKKLVDQGKIGELLAMTGTNKLNSSLPTSSAWFVDRALAGGGAVMDHTVHLADLMRWYTGSEVTEVYTEIGSNVNRKIQVEDSFLTTATFENGVIGHIDGSWSYATGFYNWGDGTLRTTGSEGVIVQDIGRQSVHLSGSESPNDKYSWQYYGCDSDLEMVRGFLDAILRDEKPRATAYDGLQGLRITLASYESAKKVRPVRL